MFIEWVGQQELAGLVVQFHLWVRKSARCWRILWRLPKHQWKPELSPKVCTSLRWKAGEQQAGNIMVQRDTKRDAENQDGLYMSCFWCSHCIVFRCHTKISREDRESRERCVCGSVLGAWGTWDAAVRGPGKRCFGIGFLTLVFSGSGVDAVHKEVTLTYLTCLL